jgi:hypothetical protein
METKIWLSQQWPKTLRAVGRLTVGITALCLLGVLRAAELPSSNSPSQPATTVLLEYHETAYSIYNCGVSITPQSAPFKKEPAAVSGKIIRGVLNFSGGSSNAISFLWQREAGKLYLDLNRNQDLTDDQAGVLSARRGPGSIIQTFTNVHLLFYTSSGKCPALIDLSFWDYGPRPSCYAAARSFWQGKVTLHGQNWQAGFVPMGLHPAGSFENGWLVLRQWQECNQTLNDYSGTLSMIPFTRKLFVGGHAYQLTSIAGSQNSEARPELQFAEQTVALGQLKITGKFIHRLTLSGGPYLVVLDHPVEVVEVPIGRYNPPDILLEQGDTKAYCLSRHWGFGQRISVDGKTPPILTVGGPLTNSVTVTRQGQDLLLNYQLIGVAGQIYQLANRDYAHPPEFAVYKGDRKIASGKFQYG